MNINIRPATQGDIQAINRVIEVAVMTWSLPERVKRLSLSSYRYTSLDFDHLEIVVAEGEGQTIIGVAAWELADAKDTPAGHTALLLHGIYVDPMHQRRSVGRQLFKEAERAVGKHHCDGLLVKAQSDASGFFVSLGMNRLPAEDPLRHYANRFWKITNA